MPDTRPLWINDPLSDAELRRQMLSPFGWAYVDLYLVPPVCGEDWSGGNVLRPGITETMVAARRRRADELIREHGRQRGWSTARIKAEAEHATTVWLDRWDYRLPSLGYSEDWPDRLMSGKPDNDDNWE